MRAADPQPTLLLRYRVRSEISVRGSIIRRRDRGPDPDRQVAYGSERRHLLVAKLRTNTDDPVAERRDLTAVQSIRSLGVRASGHQTRQEDAGTDRTYDLHGGCLSVVERRWCPESPAFHVHSTMLVFYGLQRRSASVR